MARVRGALLAIAYAALVAHLLFVPYAYAPLGLGEALARFSHVAWDRLGSDQNIALVSRSVMFAPLGLLLASALVPLAATAGARVAAFVAATAIGCATAVAINFAQLWFPSRTVNLNNVAFEAIGVAAGAVAWVAGGAAAQGWLGRLASGGRVGWRALLGGYVAAYALASLAPFDFVTSAAEMSEKLGSQLYAWWSLPGGCGSAPCNLRFLVAGAAALPCGWWLAGLPRRVPLTAGRAAGAAIAVSAAIELLHLVMVSGVSQGGSFVFRAAGLAAGALAYPLRSRLETVDLDCAARWLALAAVLPWLAAVAWVAGWGRGAYAGFAGARERFGSISWIPFLNQYYSPYADTMQSTIVHAAMYGAAGGLLWLASRDRARTSATLAAALAGTVAVLAETSKLLLGGRLPDYADVLIALAAAPLAVVALRAAARGAPGEGAGATATMTATASAGRGSDQRSGRDRDRDGDRDSDRSRGGTAWPDERTAPARSAATARGARGGAGATRSAEVAARSFGVLLLVAALATVVAFPVWRIPLGLGLAAYGALLARVPLAYLVAVPALLPVLDLAPWSGRFYWTEFDALLAVTLGVRLLAALPAGVRRLAPAPAGGLAKAGAVLLAGSVAASALVGLLPLAPIDSNAFTNYLSGYNALRVAKGYAWAGAFVWLVRRDAAAFGGVGRLLSAGLVAALATAVAGVFVERLAFLGAGTLDAAFRASGLVAATHVGGAYLEAMLVVLAPFSLAAAVGRGPGGRRAAAFALVALGAVAVLLTISRAAFASLLLALASFGILRWLTGRAARAGGSAAGAAAAATLVVAGIAIAAALAAQSDALRARLATSSPDAGSRFGHWSESLDLLPGDPLHLVLGKGLGSFPREFYLAYAAQYRLPAFRIEAAGRSEPSRLVLGGGGGLFVDQRVDAPAGRTLTLAGRVRSPTGGAALGISLCAKSMLNSVACEGTSVAATADWQPFEATLRRPDGGTALAAATPITLSLSNGGFGTRVEVTQLSLRDGGRELLRNGSFADGLDSWFFTSDVHAAWRVLNTPLQVLFEQGVLGLAALALVAAAFVRAAFSRAPPGRGAALVASLVGALGVGAFDSLLDAPSLLLLFGLLAGLAACRDAGPGASGAGGRGR